MLLHAIQACNCSPQGILYSISISIVAWVRSIQIYLLQLSIQIWCLSSFINLASICSTCLHFIKYILSNTFYQIHFIKYILSISISIYQFHLLIIIRMTPPPFSSCMEKSSLNTFSMYQQINFLFYTILTSKSKFYSKSLS